MKWLYIILVFLFLGCSGSNEQVTAKAIFVNKPLMPIGGDEEVRSIFKDELGDTFDDLAGVEFEFSLVISQIGFVGVRQVIGIKDKK